MPNIENASAWTYHVVFDAQGGIQGAFSLTRNTPIASGEDVEAIAAFIAQKADLPHVRITNWLELSRPEPRNYAGDALCPTCGGSVHKLPSGSLVSR